MLSDEQADRVVRAADFVWHQRFPLSDNVVTPGANNIEWLVNRVGLSADLEGASVLDIGTTNGGAAFIAEQRGAAPVVAVDIYGPDHFGFAKIKEALGSRAEFVQGTVYQLPEVLRGRQFDEVLFLGVLYHLRHPLLALDALRRLTGRTLYLETAVTGLPSDPPVARFFRRDELAGDSSNWFAPTIDCLVDWVESSGFVVDQVDHWPDDRPTRASVRAHPSNDPPEFVRLSYEVPLRVVTDPTDQGI
jgi:tRNA (mo5U34)-methyltransferase